MPVYSYPGVYVQELPSGVNAIAGVATSIAAFAGWAAKGPTNQAILVQSWTDYATQFGGLDARSWLGYAVSQFFLNGGQQAYIVRLAQSAAITGTASGVAPGSIVVPAGGTSTLTFTAQLAGATAPTPGAWSSSYGVQVAASTSGAAGSFKLLVVYAPSSTGIITLETFDNLVAATLTNTSIKSNYVAMAVSGTPAVPATGLYRLAGGTDGNGVGVPPAAPALVNITGLSFDPSSSPSKVQLTSAGSGGLTLTAASQGVWGNSYTVQLAPRPDDYTRFSLNVIATDPTTQAQTTIEAYSNLSLNANDPQGRYVVNILNEQSAVLDAAMSATSPLAIKLVSAVPSSIPVSGVGSVPLTGGNDGLVLSPTTTSGTPGPFETALNASLTGANGLALLGTVPAFNLLCVPGEIDPSTISLLQAFCVTNRAFLIVDCQSTDTVASLQAGPNSAMLGANAINSALYFPWVNAFDPQTNMTRAFPPSGFVAGLYAATDTDRGVWKAPAGIDASLTGESSLTAAITDQQNGVLNILGINCLRNFRAYGDVVWGARTLRGSDQVGSQWKYVPIRRLALYLESSLYDGTQWVVFEPNDETLWGQIRLNVGAFLQGLFLQGAFQGSTPSQAYFVKCDAENNPQASIDLGIVNVLVGFAPLYPAEFVVIQIQQMTGQTSN